MARGKAKQTPQARQPNPEGISRITVGNFKSIVGEQSIEIRPLTILAGANSSGKSSMMQPLLLLKQTLEAPYDPGALLLDGPNVKFSQADQLLSRGIDGQVVDTFSVGIAQGDNLSIQTFLRKGEDGVFEVEKTIHKYVGLEYCIRSDMSPNELTEKVFSFHAQLTSRNEELLAAIQSSANSAELDEFRKTTEDFKKTFVTFKHFFEEQMKVEGTYPFLRSQNRCFLDYAFTAKSVANFPESLSVPLMRITDALHQTLHLPGLRGNPQRTYPLISLGPNFTNFSGTFENYTASVISYWQKNKAQETLDRLNRDLARLGLTNKIVARQVTGAHVELLVNRFLHNCDGVEDMVNIADVGFGVSQAVPVVVALHAAEPGQLVYIEQPEIHLYPRAQSNIAELLANAALAGKRVLIETHSDLVLSGVQTLVAEGKLPPELVKLHWFEQLADGSTKIISADLDKAGAFGDWPEDFHNVILAAENRYLNAAEARLMGE